MSRSNLRMRENVSRSDLNHRGNRRVWDTRSSLGCLTLLTPFLLILHRFELKVWFTGAGNRGVNRAERVEKSRNSDKSVTFMLKRHVKPVGSPPCSGV